MIDGGVSEAFLGAAIGALLQGLVKAGSKVKHKAAIFESTMNQLIPILEYAQRVLKYCNVNDDTDVTELTKLIHKGEKLVQKCSTFKRWEYARKIRYQRKLFKLNQNLLCFLISYLKDQNQAILHALINLHSNMMDAILESRINELKAILEISKCVVNTQYCNDNNVIELTKLMDKGEKLVQKCSTFKCWEYVRKIRYQRKLLELNKELVFFLIPYVKNQNQATLQALINLQKNMIDK